MSQRISEQAVLFGSWTSLVGIVTKAVSPASANRPAIVILNTGIIHRVGHHRMFVTMSRALGAVGYTVLRFDFSGIGDSSPRYDGLSLVDACMAEIREALDWLERDGAASRMILIGLCSGADHAVLYGHTDPRIVGLVLMDPSIPPTLRYYVHHIGRRLRRLRTWFNVLSGRSRTLRMLMRHMLPIAQRYPLQNRVPRQTIERHYRNSVDSGIEILAIFTEETTRQTYREQMIEALPNVSFGDRLTLEFFPGSDHTFALESDRSRLIQLILQWVSAVSKTA
ncbi:MAG TPA: alpha/beta fold hydrolase [Acetobacteraceae bacterium]|nr:alpha/beta fold hydrolase [Acetobacteraceae bacterium]